ncbi:MAG: flagellar hook-associated protein FlgL [Negativicutes bacterium]|nr:flagellar hook-associated protein FlgL [Negativicutes bacterium]
MRVTTTMLTNNFLASFNKSQENLSNLQEQLSDGKIVHKPSDDPVRAFRSLTINDSLTMNVQYNQNASDGINWMSQSDTALQSLDGIMQKAKDIVTQAISPNPSVAYSALSEQLDGLINEAVSLGNTQMGDKYIFAGQQDKVAGGPFARTTINGQDVVVYKGDYNKVSMPIQPGAPNPNQDSVNVTGDQIFGPMTTVGGQATAGIFTDLINIKKQLDAATPDLNYLSTTGMTDIDKDTDRILLADTQIGTRQASYQMAVNMMATQNTTITGNLTTNDDIDIAKTTIDFKSLQNVYQASLSVGAQILPVTLANFLK